MIILDTNVISELIKRSPDKNVLAWFDRQTPQIIATTAITVAELRYGINALPVGKRQKALADAISATLEQDLEGNVLAFDWLAAEAFGVLAAKLKAAGTPAGNNDTMIAAIALAHEAILVTRNDRHFLQCGIDVVNPFETGE